jgi:hypothetical protein
MAEVLLEKLLVPQQLTEWPHFRELDGSLKRSQQPVTLVSTFSHINPIHTLMS